VRAPVIIKAEVQLNDLLSAMQYPHWMIVAGVVFLLLGFIGLAFSRNRNGI